MTLSILIAVLGVWAVLSLLGGEMQHQRQKIELEKQLAARRAARKAAAASRIIEVAESKLQGLRR